jgi:ribose transport system substrate-binding protein
LQQHPEMKVVSQQSTGYDSNKANAVMQTVIQQEPELCGVMGIWDSMDVGTGSAVIQAGQQGKIYVVTSGGGTKTACENIERGIFSAYLSYNAPLQGELLNARISELLETNKPAGDVKTTFFIPLARP